MIRNIENPWKLFFNLAELELNDFLTFLWFIWISTWTFIFREWYYYEISAHSQSIQYIFFTNQQFQNKQKYHLKRDHTDIQDKTA